MTNISYGKVLLFSMVMICGFCCCPASIKADSLTNGIALSYMEKSEFLVKYKDNIQSETVVLSDPGQYNLVMERYKNMDNVEYVEPNFIYRAVVIKYDPYYRNQWYLQKVKAPEAWDKISESPSVTIAIIDSGVDIRHPDLKDNIWINKKEIPGNGIDDDRNGYVDDVNGWDFVNNTAEPTPKFSEGFTEDGIMHGTIVAGIAAAKGGNGIGLFGTTWTAQIMSLKVLDDKGEGNTGNVIRAVNYAVDNGANIINFSFVGLGYSQGLESAIKRAYKAGVIIIAAAGNEQENGEGYSLDTSPMYPICHDGANGENWVIGVAATDAIDQKADFSSYGFKCVDITSPGISIYSTVAYYPDKSLNNIYFNNYYDGYWSGTSVAAPIVTGALSLVMEANASLSGKKAAEILLTGSDNIYRVNPNFLGQLGKGRLNILNSVELAQAPLKSFSNKIMFAPYSKAPSEIKITDINGQAYSSSSIKAYDMPSMNGLSLAAGNINKDKFTEIITGAGQGEQPLIKIITSEGLVRGQFLAYGKDFKGGISVAAGDLDGDGIDEIIAGAGPGGGPHVRIFNDKGAVLGQFFAFSKNFKGGISVAAGDLDGDGIDEIIAGAGPGGGPHVRIFDISGKLRGQFFAYAENFKGGVRVASGDVSPLAYGRRDEIVTAPWSLGSPQIRIFNFKFDPIAQWYAFHAKFRGGTSLAVADLDNDGRDEIIAAAGPGGGPHIKTFKLDGQMLSSFYAYQADFNGGVAVGAVKFVKEITPFQE